MTQLVFGSDVFGLGLVCRLGHVRITSWVQHALNSVGTQTGVTVPKQAVLQVGTAPSPASQIPLTLGSELFSLPPLPHQPGTGSGCSVKTQRGSWGSQSAEPSAAEAPAIAQVPGLERPCATDTSVLATQQLPPNFVTAAVSQDMATVPARKGTFYPAETGQQFKWGNVITHTSVWPSDGI